MFLVEYNNPLDVGYFYPTGDIEFKKILINAITKALIENSFWKNDFKKDLEESLISLLPVDSESFKNYINSA